jgi:hypothetical protein
MHSVNHNAMPPNILIVSSQSQERDTHTYIHTHSSSSYYLCFSMCEYVVPFGTTKAKRKNTLMTAIRRSCSCTYIYMHMMVTRRKEKEKIVKYSYSYIGKRRWRKIQFNWSIPSHRLSLKCHQHVWNLKHIDIKE